MGQVWSRFWTSAPRWFLKESTSPLERFYVFNFSVKEHGAPGERSSQQHTSICALNDQGMIQPCTDMSAFTNQPPSDLDDGGIVLEELKDEWEEEQERAATEDDDMRPPRLSFVDEDDVAQRGSGCSPHPPPPPRRRRAASVGFSGSTKPGNDAAAGQQQQGSGSRQNRRYFSLGACRTRTSISCQVRTLAREGPMAAAVQRVRLSLSAGEMVEGLSESVADLSLGETTFDIPVVQDHRQGAAEQAGGSRGRRVTVTLESSNVDRELDQLNVEVDEQAPSAVVDPSPVADLQPAPAAQPALASDTLLVTTTPELESAVLRLLARSARDEDNPMMLSSRRDVQLITAYLASTLGLAGSQVSLPPAASSSSSSPIAPTAAASPARGQNDKQQLHEEVEEVVEVSGCKGAAAARGGAVEDTGARTPTVAASASANVSSRGTGGSGRKSRRKIRLSSPEFAELPAPSQEGRTIIDDFWAMD